MAESTHETRKIWTTGRRSCNACVTVTIYPHSIIATADEEKITQAMMHRTLDREFKRHTFYFTVPRDGILRCDADRWTGDGLDPLRWCDTCDCFAINKICSDCNKSTRLL